MKSASYALRVVMRWAILTALLTAGLFFAAGTTRISMLRAYLVVFSAMLLVAMLAVDLDLALERAHPSAGAKDQGVRFASGFLFLVTVAAAAMDVGRLHQSDNVPPGLTIVALAVFAASLTLQAWAMVVNPFFSPAIRLQSERGHYVITRGPYRFLRHPGYLAMLIAMPASAPAIGSWLALIPATGFGLVIMRRARLEDQFLKRNLPGYIDYMERVPAGLFPRLTALRAALLVLVGLVLRVAGLVYAASSNSTAGLRLLASPFNEQRAFGDLKYLASLGPRPLGSDAHEAATTYIFSSLLAAGVDLDHAHIDTFRTSTPIGQLAMANVIAKIPGAQPDTVILGGHYDTKRMTTHFVGANDGASSAAFLLEMARLLVHRQNRFTYWIVFFDGEEALKEWSASDSCTGVAISFRRSPETR